MYRFDIFCDASVGPELKGACAGALVEKTHIETGNIVEKKFHAIIQPNGTNNSGEAAAVTLGVIKALEIFHNPKYFGEIKNLNIFSDSLITINGVREWIPRWIRNASEDGTFIASNGDPVKNQFYFKYIFNTIILNRGIKLRFYHQDGHVTTDFDSIIPRFRKFNNIYLSDIGLSSSHICINNDLVDTETRRIINDYLMNGNDNGYPIERYFWGADVSDSSFYKILDNSENAINAYMAAIT